MSTWAAWKLMLHFAVLTIFDSEALASGSGSLASIGLWAACRPGRITEAPDRGGGGRLEIQDPECLLTTEVVKGAIGTSSQIESLFSCREQLNIGMGLS